MFLKPVKAAMALGALCVCSLALAQATDANKALLDILIKKGVLTQDEATQISQEVVQSQKGQDVITNPADGFLKKLTFSGRFQVQFDDIGASIDGNPVNPVATERFMIRRAYVGVRADFTNNLYGQITYDFANDSFDKFLLGWKQSDLLVLQTGLDKAPFGYEEMTSSGNLKAIERSPLTRYFDEGNNGRRLGAASYRIGLYASGTANIFFYNVAITNPDRNEYSGDGTSGVAVNSQPAVNTAASTNVDNSIAYYGTAGIADKFTGGSYRLGVEAGFLPDQGGPGTTLGNGNNISLYGAYGDVTYGNFNLQAEYESAKDDHGVSATQDAKPSGYWVQPAYFVIPKTLEAVVRYSELDSDHRGVALSDGIRSAPSGGTMDKMDELYVGGNWYIDGNDVKLSLGYTHGESKDTVTGGPAKANSDGVRSQMQVQF